MPTEAPSKTVLKVPNLKREAVLSPQYDMGGMVLPLGAPSLDRKTDLPLQTSSLMEEF